MDFVNRVGLVLLVLVTTQYSNSSADWYSVLCLIIQYVGVAMFLFQPSKEDK